MPRVIRRKENDDPVEIGSKDRVIGPYLSAISAEQPGIRLTGQGLMKRQSAIPEKAGQTAWVKCSSGAPA